MIPVAAFAVAFVLGCAWGGLAHFLALPFWLAATAAGLIGLIVSLICVALEGGR